jgi:hypothetical protein
MKKETNIPKEILAELTPKNKTELDIIAYTLWGVIHKLPIEVVMGMVMKEVIQEGLGDVCCETEQDWKNFLHSNLFFDECRAQGLDEDGEDIYEYYEEKWENL